MNKIDMIIWSRNRAAQCQLLLKSATDRFKNIANTFVLYRADDEQFKLGYTRLKEKVYGLNIEFIEEKNFETDIKDILRNKIQTEYVLGNSDDNIFVRDVSLHNFNLPNNVVAFSLRLGKSINYCLPADIWLRQPEFSFDFDNFLMWDWTIYGEDRGGWGYPHPCDSNIYRTQYWNNLIKDNIFNNPRQLEDGMNEHRDLRYPYMMSFNESRLISIQANDLGQGANIKTNGTSLEELNNKFLNGYTISTGNIYGIQPNSCHVMLDYNLEKE